MGVVQWVLLVAIVTSAGCASGSGGSGRGATEQRHSEQSDLTAEQLEDVHLTMQKGSPSLTRCYNEEMRLIGKKFETRILIKMLIGTEGAATRVSFGKATYTSQSFENCMAQAVKSWDFPRIRRPTWFTHPLSFSPAY